MDNVGGCYPYLQLEIRYRTELTFMADSSQKVKLTISGANQEQPHRSAEVDRGRRKVMGGSPGFQPGFLPQTQGQQPNALNIHNGSNM